MATLYLDHSTITDERSWDALVRAVADAGLQPVLSLWNLYEIANADDQAQKARRLALLDRLKPIWIKERLDIQDHEMKRYLWRQFYSVEADEFVALTPSLAVVVSYSAGCHTKIGLTAREFIAGIEPDRAAFDRLRAQCPQALKTLQTADKKELKAKAREMSAAWLLPRLPQSDPNGRALTKTQQASCLNHCLDNLDGFLRACPTFAVEDAISNARTCDLRRKPTESDGPDLQHLVPALAHCDGFYSQDKYQRWCAECARKALPNLRLSEVFGSIDEIASQFDAASAA